MNKTKQDETTLVQQFDAYLKKWATLMDDYKNANNALVITGYKEDAQ